MMRRYNRWWGRFDQPDPYDGSYDLTDPQSLNRYSYTQNDPVNFTDPTGLDPYPFRCTNCHLFGDSYAGLGSGIGGGGIGGGGNGLFGGIVIAAEEGADGPGGSGRAGRQRGRQRGRRTHRYGAGA